MYSIGTPFFFAAATISSDSTLSTRGSLAPCRTISGALIFVGVEERRDAPQPLGVDLGVAHLRESASRNDAHHGGDALQRADPVRDPEEVDADGERVRPECRAASTM